MDISTLSFVGVGVVRGLLLLAGYIGGQKSFPLPLPPEEESRCISRMRSGDRQARDKLIRHNLRLVAHIVKKFDCTGEDSEDLISIGTIGLIKGINTFDPSRRTRLATYAARCIENEILMHLRATRRERMETSLQDPIGTDRDGNEITLMDILSTDAEALPELVSRRSLCRELRQRLEFLDQRERRVIELRYGLDGGACRTQREIARDLDISRSYVSRIEKKAVGKLNQLLLAGMGEAGS